MTPFFNAFAIENHTGMSIETMQDYRDIAINAVSSYTASILTRQGMVADGTAYECPICFEDDMIPGNLCTECNQSCCVVCENKWNASCPFCRHATWCVMSAKAACILLSHRLLQAAHHAPPPADPQCLSTHAQSSASIK